MFHVKHCTTYAALHAFVSRETFSNKKVKNPKSLLI